MAELLNVITAKELLAIWDAGESIFTVEMGGLGPGYEQCIHILVMEIIRDEADNQVPDKEWGSWGEKAISRVDRQLHLSGAQVGAARYLASQLIAKGPALLYHELKMVEQDSRLIQVSKDFPQYTPGVA